MKNKKRLTKASRKGRLRGGNTLFSASHFRSISADEVVHDLIVVQFGDRGKDTTGITGEKDDVSGMVVGDAGNFRVGNEIDWVGATSILCES